MSAIRDIEREHYRRGWEDGRAEAEEQIADAVEANRDSTEMRNMLLRIIASDETCDTSKAMARNALRNTGMSEPSIDRGVNARRRPSS